MKVGGVSTTKATSKQTTLLNLCRNFEDLLLQKRIYNQSNNVSKFGVLET